MRSLLQLATRLVNTAAVRPPLSLPQNIGLMLGSDKSRGYCLEMICTDFLAGVSLETGNQSARLAALTRIVRGLPKPRRIELLEAVQVAP
jgi:hypothetical protein